MCPSLISRERSLLPNSQTAFEWLAILRWNGAREVPDRPIPNNARFRGQMPREGLFRPRCAAHRQGLSVDRSISRIGPPCHNNPYFEG